MPFSRGATTNRRALLAIAVLAFPAPALAKAPSKASVTGPGLSTPITLTGDGEKAGTPLGDLARQAGYAPAVFGHREPDPMSRTRPNVDLGPRYTITYTAPGPDHDTVRLRQDVYPYAEPSPVTYMPAGQEFFLGITTYGGWFKADPRLEKTLVSAGLPAAPDAGSWGDSLVSKAALGVLAAAAILVGAAAAAIVLRRRVRRAPAA